MSGRCRVCVNKWHLGASGAAGRLADGLAEAARVICRIPWPLRKLNLTIEFTATHMYISCCIRHRIHIEDSRPKDLSFTF
jgi:hypothetical protein